MAFDLSRLPESPGVNEVTLKMCYYYFVCLLRLIWF